VRPKVHHGGAVLVHWGGGTWKGVRHKKVQKRKKTTDEAGSWPFEYDAVTCETKIAKQRRKKTSKRGGRKITRGWDTKGQDAGPRKTLPEAISIWKGAKVARVGKTRRSRSRGTITRRTFSREREGKKVAKKTLKSQKRNQGRVGCKGCPESGKRGPSKLSEKIRKR